MKLEKKMIFVIVIAIIMILAGVFVVYKSIECQNDKDEEIIENADKTEKKIVYAMVIVSKDDNENAARIDSNDVNARKKMFETYRELINSNAIKSEVEKIYSNVGNVEMEFIEETELIKVIYTCDNHSDEECKDILKQYITIFSKKIEELYGEKMYIIDEPEISLITKW